MTLIQADKLIRIVERAAQSWQAVLFHKRERCGCLIGRGFALKHQRKNALDLLRRIIASLLLQALG
jgi:hypothetical protein